MYNNFVLAPKQVDSYDIAPLSEEFTRVTITAEDGEYNALKDVNAFTYNGFFLPPLPTWDETAYPYAIVYYAPRNAGITAYFGYSDQPFYMDTTGGLVTNTPGATVYASMYDAEVCEDASTFVWQAPQLFPDAALALVPGMVVWTNVDLLDDTGAVFLRWSEAVKASFKRNLYNGVSLPELPEWDRTALPYAIIQYLYLGDRFLYSLMAFNAPGVMIYDSFGKPALRIEGENIIWSNWVSVADQFSAAGLADMVPGITSTGWLPGADKKPDDDGRMDLNYIMWSNYDLKFDDEEKTEYLKVTDPAVEYLDLPYGRTLKVEIPWGTQRNADIILSTISEYRYQPFTASKVWLDPAAELGDGITIGGTTAVLCSQDISYGSLTVSNISAPEDEELDHEYTYKTKQERQAKRTAAATRRAENVFSGTESAACLKTYELHVGGKRFVPTKITYTDGSGNTVTATVLAAM